VDDATDQGSVESNLEEVLDSTINRVHWEVN
jgi:hypothetical protein